MSLVYVSRAQPNLASPDLANILRSSREYNSDLKVTGLLIYADNCFMQVLEGLRGPVAEIYGRISVDARHSRIMTCSYAKITTRQFPDWTMAFLDQNVLSETHQAELSGCLSKWRDPFSTQSISNEAIALVGEFSRIV